MWHVTERLQLSDDAHPRAKSSGRATDSFSDILTNLLLSLSDRNVLIIAVDDLHRLDEESREYFLEFASFIDGSQCLLIATQTVSADARWVKLAHHNTIELVRFDERVCERFI